MPRSATINRAGARATNSGIFLRLQCDKSRRRSEGRGELFLSSLFLPGLPAFALFLITSADEKGSASESELAGDTGRRHGPGSAALRPPFSMFGRGNSWMRTPLLHSKFPSFSLRAPLHYTLGPASYQISYQKAAAFPVSILLTL